MLLPRPPGNYNLSRGKESCLHVGTYWLREGKSNNAEIDFLIQLGSDIVPLEIKAGKSGTLKSLLEFVHLRDLSRGVRLDTNVPGIQDVSHKRTQSRSSKRTEFSLLSLPLYMIEQLPRLMEEPKQSPNTNRKERRSTFRHKKVKK